MPQSSQLERRTPVSSTDVQSQHERASRSAVTILHVLAPGAYGGLEHVVRDLATGHAEQGHSVHVAALIDQPADHTVHGAATQTRVPCMVGLPARSTC